jgi:hypothetical protein
MKRKAFMVITALVLAACASGPKGTGTGSGDAAPQKAAASHIERIRVDYKGAAIGSDIPAWVEAAVDDDYQKILQLPQFKGKVPMVNYGTGQNLDLLRSWVNNFNMQAEFSRRVSNSVTAKFGGTQLGSKDTPENRNLLQEIIGTFSRTEINGLAKEMDYWIKLRTIDRQQGSESEQYYYYVIYSISQDDLDYQIAQALGKVAAKTKEQEELKADVQTAMKEAAAFGSIEAAQ